MPLILVMLRFTLQSFQLNLSLNLFQIQTPLQSNQLMTMKWTISWDSFTKNMMRIFWMLTSRCLRIDWWSSLLKMIAVSTVLFCKDGGASVAVTNCMSQFSMFVPTKATAKLANGNTGHVQVIEIISFS